MVPNLLSFSRLEIDTLVLQPFNSCPKNCKGCYVKLHEQKGKQLHWTHIYSLLITFLIEKKAICNQIILSLDDIDRNNLEATRNTTSLFDSFINILLTYTNTKRRLPKIQITCRNIESLLDYFRLTNVPMEATLRSLDMISFSNLKSTEQQLIEYIRRFIRVNYNHMPPWPSDYRVDKEEEYKNALASIAKFVDSIYYIIPKKPTGDLNETSSKSNVYLDWIWYYLNVIDHLPINLKGKITRDTCFHDIQSYKLDPTKGCSANISKFTVWPDGAVSGCPYAKIANTLPARNVEEILENLQEAKNYHYDFERCYLKYS